MKDILKKFLDSLETLLINAAKNGINSRITDAVVKAKAEANQEIEQVIEEFLAKQGTIVNLLGHEFGTQLEDLLKNTTSDVIDKVVAELQNEL